MFIPRVSGNQAEPFGAALYISPKIRRTLFTQLYLYGKESDNFKIVYQDTQNIQLGLALYNGRLVGPIKIWEMNYPENLEPSKWYYGNELPDINVMGA